jgi:N-acetylglucosaminyldiphosphoundecaprenol N-acetyl-beta-D-mannosaminyltransferase
MAAEMTISRRCILGIPVDGYTFQTWLDQIDTWLKEDSAKLHHICTVNPEFVMIAQQNHAFFNLLQRVDVCLADGVGLLLAAKYLGKPLPERVTGSDGLVYLAEQASQKGWRLFLLGAAEGVAQQAADKLTERYPTLQIAGVYAGSPRSEEAAEIIERVNASHADILLVAYGAPRQDLWIDQHRNELKVKVAMGVGGSYDFIAGIVPRAPQTMQRLGLEWLYRLYREPWRWRRMLRLPLFVLAVLRYREEAIPHV